MSLVGQYYWRLAAGPHGNAKVMAAGTFVCASGAILSTVQYEMMGATFLALGVVSGLLLLVLLVGIVDRLRAKLNDVHYAISLEGGLRRAGYSISDLFTDEGAANPSLQLLNLKVLRMCQPRSILELGSGQTTKLLSCYARDNPSAYVLTLEQDPAWVNRLKDQVSHDYRHIPLERKDFACAGSGRRLSTSWYRDVPGLLDRQFDYILVDGPDPGTVGTAHTDYARSGLLQHMPTILGDSFIVVFDDAERYGEVMTINALKRILSSCGVRFVTFGINGIKRQVVLCSPDRAFLRSV